MGPPGLDETRIVGYITLGRFERLEVESGRRTGGFGPEFGSAVQVRGLGSQSLDGEAR